MKCPLCNQVTNILNIDEHNLETFDVEKLIKLVPRNQALMNIMEEDDFIEEVQVKVPISQVVFGSKKNENQGQNKLAMTPLIKLDSKPITNLSDSPLDDENNFTTARKSDHVEIYEEDSCVYSDNGGADSVRQSVIVMH